MALISPLAAPRSPGAAITRAPAADSLIIEIGPCWPAANMVTVTSSGASATAFHSASVKSDLSAIDASSLGVGARYRGLADTPTPGARGFRHAELVHPRAASPHPRPQGRGSAEDRGRDAARQRSEPLQHVPRPEDHQGRRHDVVRVRI